MSGTDDEVIAVVPIRSRVIDTAGGLDGLEYFADCPVTGHSSRLDTCQQCPRQRGLSSDGASLICQVPAKSEVAGNDACPRCEASAGRTPVRAVMRRETHCVEEDLPATELAQVFATTKARSLPVVDEDGVLVGVVTDRDLVRGARLHEADAERGLEQGFPPDLLGRHAGELMSAPAVSLLDDATVGDALELFRNHAFRALPVVDDGGAVVGIVTTDDLVRWFGARLHAGAPAPTPVPEPR